jgi:hypothetical protein
VRIRRFEAVVRGPDGESRDLAAETYPVIVEQDVVFVDA